MVMTKAVQKIIASWKRHSLVEDRMEYDRSDLRCAHPDITRKQVDELYKWLHKDDPVMRKRRRK
jgi:hypothetical protein